MKIVFLTFFVLLFFIFAMAIGYIIAGKRLKGSCGGLGAVMGEDCMFCSKKDKCEKREVTKEVL
jgi:uncharacterized protein